MISSVYMNLIGAVLAILLIITMINMAPDLLEDNVADDQTVNKLLEALQAVNGLDRGGTEVVTVDVADGGAVVVMDTDGFRYHHDSLSDYNAGSYTHINGFYMERPLSCGDDTCVCECEEVSFSDMSPDEFNETFGIHPDVTMPDAEMMCEEPTCAETNASLKRRILPFEALGEPAEYNRDGVNQYDNQRWESSFLLPNFDEIRPAERADGKLITVGGYAGKIPRSRYTVKFNKIAGGINVADINAGEPSNQ